jgi:hypothetical protein
MISRSPSGPARGRGAGPGRGTTAVGARRRHQNQGTARLRDGRGSACRNLRHAGAASASGFLPPLAQRHGEGGGSHLTPPPAHLGTASVLPSNIQTYHPPQRRRIGPLPLQKHMKQKATECPISSARPCPFLILLGRLFHPSDQISMRLGIQ